MTKPDANKEKSKAPSPRSSTASIGKTKRMRRKRASDSDQRLAALLDRANEAVLKFRARELRPSGLSTIEAAVLFALDNAQNPTTAAEISRWISRDSASTSRLLQRMEKKGLVARARDLGRRNLVRVSMTNRGHAAYQQALLSQRSTRHPVSSLSERQKKQLEALLRILLQSSVARLGINRNDHFA